MNLKPLRSALSLLAMSALFMDGAIAQPGRTPSAADWKDKFANDYANGNFRAAIADAAALDQLHALDTPSAIVTAQAYYKAGDFAGCAKYIRENPYLSRDPILYGKHPVALLLERCQKS